MKKGFLNISSLGLALTMAACSSGQLEFQGDSAKIELRPAQEIVAITKDAKINPTENYFLGQATVQLTHEGALADTIANLDAKGIDARLLDKVPNRPIYLLQVKSVQSVPEVVKALKQDKSVVTAEPNYSVTASSIRASDPLVPTQWALHNFGQEAPHSLAGKSGADIGMENIAAQGSKDIVVGIIDTGLDYFHEDLAETETVNGKTTLGARHNIWTNTEEIPDNGVNDDNNGDSRHGIMYTDDYYGYNFADKTGDPRDDHGE